MRKELQAVAGAAFEAVTRRDESGDWVFGLTGGGMLAVACLWRVTEKKQLVLTSSDHGQAYGLPAPLDAAKEAQAMVVGRAIESVDVGPTAGDVTFNLNGGTSVQLLVDSGGYEAWQMTMPDVALFVGRADGISVFPMT